MTASHSALNSFAALRASRLVPQLILNRVASRESYDYDLSHYALMEDNDLLYATEVCLKNLEYIDDCAASPDSDLQLILVPELWERIRPGTRDKLRHISSTLAEYDPDPTPPSIFRRLLTAQALKKLREGADDLRHRLKHAAQLDVPSLVEQVRFAIAGSHAADRWEPDACVYEPGFVYRLVPAVATRALNRTLSTYTGEAP